MKTDLSKLILFLIVLLLHLSAEQIPIDDAPRIITENGNIIFQTYKDKSISFQTSRGGEIKLNDLDLRDLSFQIHGIMNSIQEFNNLRTCNCDLINSKLSENSRNIQTIQDSMRSSSDQIASLSTTINDIKQKLTIDDCLSNPCHNGGTCVDGYNSYRCVCTENYQGPNCMDDVNECTQLAGTDLGCQNNAVCENFVGGFRCRCVGKWSGVLCNLPLNGCAGSASSELCGHGTCISDHSSNNAQAFKCICDHGWKLDPVTKTCTSDIDECTTGRYPCSVNPQVQCINYPGHFACGSCPPGFEGNGFNCKDINECAGSAICGTNEECTNTFGSYTCQCIQGMTRGFNGQCQLANPCDNANGGCNVNAQCVRNNNQVEGRICTCNPGFTGDGVGINGCTLDTNQNATNRGFRRCVTRQLCQNGGVCQRTSTYFRCQCATGFRGPRCQIAIRNLCQPNPCLNEGQCEFLSPSHYRCHCKPFFSGVNCETENTECGGTILSPTDDYQISLMISRSAQTSGQSFRFPCTWTIIVADDQVLQVTPITLQLKGPCSEEYVQLEERYSLRDSPVALGQYCQNSNSSALSYNTTGHILIVKASLQNRIDQIHGFTLKISPRGARMNNVNCCLCTQYGFIRTNSSNGLFQSVNFPMQYPMNFICAMQYERPSDEKYRVELRIKTIDLGNQRSNCSNSDYLMITFVDQGQIKITACNQQSFYNKKIVTSGFQIHHFSDSFQDTNDARFMFLWRKTGIEDNCGGKISLNSSALIVNPTVSADSQIYCTWKVDRLNTSKIINFKATLNAWSSAGCSVFFKVISINYAGVQQIVFQTCSTQKRTVQLMLDTSDDTIIIFGKFKGASMPSFQISLNHICGRIVDMDQLPTYELQSDNYPDNYDDNSNCLYQFKSQTRKIQATFLDFDINDSLPCLSDYVQIYGANSDFLNKKFCNGNADELMTIGRNNLETTLSFHFKTNASGSGRGFKIKVDVLECGGSFFVSSRIYIAYPEGYENISTYHLDHQYRSNMNCTWDIYTKPGNYFFVLFDNFHLEHHSECSYDYLRLTYDNQTKTFCGTDAQNIHTYSNRLRIQFISDYIISGEGFQMRVYAAPANRLCHQTIETAAGTIYNQPIGSLPRPYLCVYIIKAPVGRKLVFNITIAGAEYSNDVPNPLKRCFAQARLRIMNGAVGAPAITDLCLQNPQRGEITTSFNLATIIYKVPQYRSATEFNYTIDFHSIDEECGSIHTDMSGEIASPNYPLYAPLQTFCQWEIKSRPGHQISIYISHIRSGSVDETSKCDDRNPVIKLQSLTKEIDIICSNHTMDSYTFEDRSVKIIFNNQHNNMYRFRLAYMKKCTYTLTAANGRIESDNLLIQYPNNCVWTINSLRGNKIAIEIDEFDLPIDVNGICKSFLEIKDRKGVILRQSCGNQLANRTFISSNLPITIKHQIDKRTPLNILKNHKGIVLEYQMQGCIQNIAYDPDDDDRSTRVGEIMSPQYPNSISGIDCSWTFQTTTGYSIKLTFDVVEIDSSNNCSEGSILRAWEGQNMPDNDFVLDICNRTSGKTAMVFQSSTSNLFLKFMSAKDNQGGQRRFHARYEFVNTSCEYELSLTQGTIQSPNYPKNYPHNIRCKWSLKVRESMSIHIQFTDFQTEEHNCRYDFVELFSPVNNDLTSLGKLCGTYNMSSLHFESISNHMIITFRTDNSVSHKGFKATFFEGCGGLRIATGMNQLLLSPNYPHTYSLPDNTCEWTITANISNPDERIFFYFMGFESSSRNYLSNNCSLSPDTPANNSLTIIDGMGESTAIKAVLCSTRPYHPIISTGHYLKVILRSTSGHAIFKASYGTGSSACGGTYYLDDGILTSPFYPNAMNLDMDCVYVINNSPGSTIQLIFEDFTRSNSRPYEFHDYIEVRNGPNITSPTIGRFYQLDEVQNATQNFRFNDSVWIRLRSQGGAYTNDIKFMARYHINYINAFRSDRGVFGSPQLGHVYNADTNINWNIEAETSDMLEITFKQFYVGRQLDDGTCSRGKLTITDSNGIEKIFCGSSIPPVNKFSTPISIDLAAEGYRYPGFLLEWNVPTNDTHKKIGDCNFILQATQYSQILTSPNYPGFDPKNRNCQWVIQSDDDRALDIRMMNFSLEQSYTCKYENFSVSFYGYRSVLDYYKFRFTNLTCGTPDLSFFNYFNEYYFNEIKINFQVDEFDSFPGFQLAYKTRCFYDIKNSFEGWIQNEEYPRPMTDSKNCTYRLLLRHAREYILNFSAINLPPQTNGQCVNGYIEISTPLLKQKYCGTDLPSSLTPFSTESNIVVIKLVGDFANNSPYSGFRLKYMLKEVEECGGTHYLSQPYDYLIITNPSNSSRYSPDHIECQWYITSLYGTRMMINFESLTFFNPYNYGQCNTTYLAFYDGSTRMAPLIGGSNVCKRINSIVSTGNMLLIVFKHDIGLARYRLRITINSCGGLLTKEKGIISSPNYPLNYPRQANCSWNVQLSRFNGIVIRFLDRQLESCFKSNLSFITSDDYGATENNIWNNCNQTEYFFHVINNQLKVLFTTNTTTPQKGFKLKYESNRLTCFGIHKEPSGQIQSINYPSFTPPFIHCVWKILVDPSTRIVLNISNLNLRSGCLTIHGYRFYGYFKNICQRNVQNLELDTKMSFVVLRLFSWAGARLSLNYRSDLPSECGGNIYPTTNKTSITFANMTVPFCMYRFNNYPDGKGTITFNVQKIVGTKCLPTVLSFNSKIYGGQSHSISDVLTVCNHTDPIISLSTIGQEVTLYFTQRHFVNLTNVNVRLDYKYNKCGGILTEPYGLIKSPGYPGKYPDYANCEWLLKAPEDKHIKLLIRSLHLEYHATCGFDFFHIRYGPNFNSEPFKSYCGKHPVDNETIIFRNNLLRLSFHSDYSVSKDGFLIEYTFFDAVDNCQGIIFNVSGSIQSPNYPNAHPSYLRCNWTIVLPVGYKVQLTFAHPFDLEPRQNGVCNYDFLNILDSNPNLIIDKLCGNTPPEHPITSSLNRIGLIFYTDHSLNLDGFKAFYKPICGGVFNETYGQIDSPNRYLTEANYQCNYTIPSWKNSYTALSLETNLKPCVYSNGKVMIYLEDRYGHFNFHRVVCGKSSSPINVISSRSIMLKFNITYRDVENYSFKGSYLHDQNKVVYQNITQGTYIGTPLFPSPYHHNADLYWYYEAPRGYIFFVEILSIDIEPSSSSCLYDYVGFYNDSNTNSSNLVMKLCGTNLTIAPFSIESNLLTIHFYSDSSHYRNHTGFRAYIKPTPGPLLGCGGIINVTQGVNGYLTSLDRDNNGQYDNNLHCSWRLTADFGYAVKITFENSSVNMEKRLRTRCVYDFLQIYDGPYEQSPLLQTLCGDDQVDPITSSSNNMLILFVSDQTVTRGGFKLTYTAIASPNSMYLSVTNMSKILTSPGYPSDVGFDLNTYAEINAQNESNHIIVQVTDLQIRPSANCSLDRLIIQDISLKYGNKIRKLCKSLIMPYIFISSHNNILIRFQIGPAESGYNVPIKRFSLDYKLYNCNRTEQAYSGNLINIESYRKLSYGHNQYCNITLKAPQEDLRFQFYFKKFKLETHGSCKFDYIRFIFGPPNQQVMLPKMCGSFLPASFVSNSSQVSMIFVSDQSLHYEGFHITYVVNRDPLLKCGGDIELDSGVVTSPGFGNNYYEEGQCTWNIVLQSEKSIQWKITDFGFGNSTSEEGCNNNSDYVQVNSGTQESKFCGHTFSNQPVNLNSNAITVMYKSLTGGTGIGFRLEWDISDEYSPT